MELSRRFGRLAGACVLIALAIVFFFAVSTKQVDAHTPVTSKYNYNRDVFPLLQNHCGRCHVTGGPAPMSLMTYDAAMAWAESIRDELATGRMPPWPVDPTSPPVEGGHPISSHDVDEIIVWAAGGTPQGNLEAKLPEVTFDQHWQLGPPDLKIQMDTEHTVAPNVIEEVSDFSLPTNLTDAKWVKAADLMPENASIVRDAVISIENGPVLALWEPGNEMTTAPSGAAFRMASGSKVHLEIHYKKHFDQEEKALSDRSTIGLYFTDPPPSDREMQSLAITPPGAAGDPTASMNFGGALPNAGRIVALRPMLDRAYESLNVDAITPSGMSVPLLRLHGPRPQWFQRYWLQEPVELASGSKIVVTVMPLPDYSDEPPATRQFALQVALDYIPL